MFWLCYNGTTTGREVFSALMKYCLAIDIGASSGRHIVGWQEQGQLQTKEVYRFPNGVREENGHLVWDVDALVGYVKEGIHRAKAEFPNIFSLSVDTWGVDYVLFRGEEELRPVYAYRDSRTEAIIHQVHEKMPFAELYRRTGCQFQPFNTVYQLYDDKFRGRLNGVTDMLMMPEYLLYKLCGVKAREYTNATTMGMINAQTGEFDLEIVDSLGYPRQLFPKLSQPGTVLGEYERIQCVLCATHDTGSAVEGIPMGEGNHPYISSGTWSLLGVKTPKPITDSGSEKANYSNEGGVGYNRYQKNIMGMWLVNELQRELCPDTPFPEIVRMAEVSDCEILVEANAQDFLSPKSMKAAFDKATGNYLKTTGDYFRCAYRSLALSYRQAIDELEKNTGCSYEKLYIVGGGAKNRFLNKLTEEATGKQVIALPIEATALGNLKIQMEVI
ncbi:MAG: rhamnulokinase [Oscillospiraceae bacterium]|nr:rhamnulokinase [Oscillospiraceae bacterium]